MLLHLHLCSSTSIYAPQPPFMLLHLNFCSSTFISAPLPKFLHIDRLFLVARPDPSTEPVGQPGERRDHQVTSPAPASCLLPPGSCLLPPASCHLHPTSTARFAKTATNKMRCPIFCLSWTPEGRRLITGEADMAVVWLAESETWQSSGWQSQSVSCFLQVPAVASSPCGTASPSTSRRSCRPTTVRSEATATL